MKILYLGIDPTRWIHQGTLIHYPVIRTERIQSIELTNALALWPQFTHVVFTSRSAVTHLWESVPIFDPIAIAIGEGTKEALTERGVDPMTAKEATQEGLIALLNSMDLKETFLFLPCSKKARPLLTEYLKRRKVRFLRVNLYEPIFQTLIPIPSLEGIDEIVFTSPSTVEGFLRIYGALPREKKLTAIGPVTQKVLSFHAINQRL